MSEQPHEPWDDREVRVGFIQVCAEFAVADLLETARTNPELIDPTGVADMAESLNTLAAWLAPKH